MSGQRCWADICLTHYVRPTTGQPKKRSESSSAARFNDSIGRFEMPDWCREGESNPHSPFGPRPGSTGTGRQTSPRWTFLGSSNLELLAYRTLGLMYRRNLHASRLGFQTRWHETPPVQSPASLCLHSPLLNHRNSGPAARHDTCERRRNCPTTYVFATKSSIRRHRCRPDRKLAGYLNE